MHTEERKCKLLALNPVFFLVVGYTVPVKMTEVYKMLKIYNIFNNSGGERANEVNRKQNTMMSIRYVLASATQDSLR